MSSYSREPSIKDLFPVDRGDLLEALQAAQAWASLLRSRAETGQYEFGGGLTPAEAKKRYEATADRIDRACSRLRGQAFPSV